MDTRLLIRDGESTVFPPLTESDHSQHPAGRVGVPEDITKIVEFLVDDVNGFITGQVIYRVVLFICLYNMQKFFSIFCLLQNFVVDGGMTKKMIYHE
jgi:NAD(P)-dependent dehydrogenase (short-subunit alcohol dehydrogenase family)